MKLKLLENNFFLKKELFFIPLIIVILSSFIWNTLEYTTSTTVLICLLSIIVPVVIRNIFNIKPLLFLLISFPVLIIAIIQTVSLFEYQSDLSINTWEVIFNGNSEEAVSFLSELKTTTISLVLFKITIFLLYFFILIKKKNLDVIKKRRKLWLILGIILIIDFGLNGATRKIFPLNFFESINNYTKEKIKEREYFYQKQEIIFNTKRNDKLFAKEEKETIVIVVGESLRRDHLEYYGYNKETTPLLKKEELICYTDVISPANQSVISLKRIFSLAEYKDITGYLKHPSLIKVFKEAGFKTYWISTQRIYGFFDSEISYIAKEADEVIFEDYNGLDEQLFKPYKKVLSKKNNKKIIFLHIMGNHFSYKKRTHSDFFYFDNNKGNKKQQLINQYDDSVRYNDFVLSFFLNELKKIKGEKSFLMFSDHGESLFDSGENLAFHSSIKPSKSEFNIPLVLWLSKEVKDNYPNRYQQVIQNKDKPIILSDFFHALPFLYGIEFSKLNKEKAFFNKTYVPVLNRKVLNPERSILKYDTLISKKN